MKEEQIARDLLNNLNIALSDLADQVEILEIKIDKLENFVLDFYSQTKDEAIKQDLRKALKDNKIID